MSKRRQIQLSKLKNELEIETIVILETLKTTKLTKQELLQTINMASHTDTVKRYIQPLLDHKLIERSIKDKPTSPNQRYGITKLGLAFLELCKN